jgi:hypothetical protein
MMGQAYVHFSYLPFGDCAGTVVLKKKKDAFRWKHLEASFFFGFAVIYGIFRDLISDKPGKSAHTQHDPSQLVRESHGRHREPQTACLLYLQRKTKTAADDKRNLPCIMHGSFLQKARKCGRIHFPALNTQWNHCSAAACGKDVLSLFLQSCVNLCLRWGIWQAAFRQFRNRKLRKTSAAASRTLRRPAANSFSLSEPIQTICTFCTKTPSPFPGFHAGPLPVKSPGRPVHPSG